MHLAYRRPMLHELPMCLALIGDGFAYDRREKVHLLRLWQEIMEQRRGQSSVVERADQGPDGRIVAFGISAFVTDEFMCEARAGTLPYIGRRVLKRWMDGCSPLLTPNQIRTANSAEGLNVLVLHAGVREIPALSSEVCGWALHCLLDSFVACHRGYRIKGVLPERYDSAFVRFCLGTGLTLITDYAEKLQENPIFASCPAKRPYLPGVLLEAALRRPQTFTFQVIENTPPRFGFTGADRDLLHWALRGRTDGDIARELMVAVITVKKRWEEIYGRISAVDSSFFGEPKWRPERRTRGPEKRRRVLAYVQEHPEELEPIEATRTSEPAARP